MGTSLGEAVLDLVGDDTKLKADIAKAEQSTQAALKKVGKGLTKAGTVLTAGITLPLVGMGLAAISAASDMSESMSKVNVVFEDSADTVIAFSETSAEKLGISQQAALEAAGTYGNLFTAMGMGEDTAADMSVSLVTLAADLASFNNMDVTEVLDALRSGLSGETEPLKRLGVNINQATLEAKALEMGLWDGVGALDANQKAQATYALVMEQTTKAQGDFSRTQDGLANSTKTVKATLADLGAQLGTFLMPIALSVVGVIQSVVTWFSALSPTTQKVILVVLAVVAAIGPLLLIIGQLITAVSTIMPVLTAVSGVLTGPVLLAIGAVIAVIALLVAAWNNNWFGIRDTLTAVWEEKIKPIVEALWTWLQTNIPIALEALKAWWQDVLLPAIQKVWEWISTVLIPFFQDTVVPWLQDKIGAAITTLSDFWTNTLLPAITAVWDWISTTLIPFFQDTLVPWLQDTITAAITTLSGFWTDTLQPAIEAVWTFINDSLLPIFQNIVDIIDIGLTLAITALQGLWENILLPAITAVWTYINDNLLPILEDVRAFIADEIGPKVQWFTDEIITPLATAIGTGLTDALAWINDQLSAFKAWLESITLPDWLTPGSPTPFEIGLWGIGRAMEDLARKGLPTFAAELQLQPAGGLASLAAGGGRQTVNQYYLTAQYRTQPETTLIEQVRLLDLMGGG